MTVEIVVALFLEHNLSYCVLCPHRTEASCITDTFLEVKKIPAVSGAPVAPQRRSCRTTTTLSHSMNRPRLSPCPILDPFNSFQIKFSCFFHPLFVVPPPGVVSLHALDLHLQIFKFFRKTQIRQRPISQCNSNLLKTTGMCSVCRIVARAFFPVIGWF